MRIRSLIVFLSLAVIVVAVTLVAAGCEATVTTDGMTSYSNDEYGFSFEIADRFEEGDDPTLGQVSGNVAFAVGFGDPDGAKNDAGVAVDVFLVSVYELSQPVTPDLMPAMKSELEGVLAQLAAQDPGTSLAPLTEITINGTPGFMTEGTTTSGGAPVQSRIYFLVDGATEYQITLQSSVDTWDENEADLQKAADSFTVEEAAAQ